MSEEKIDILDADNVRAEIMLGGAYCLLQDFERFMEAYCKLKPEQFLALMLFINWLYQKDYLIIELERNMEVNDEDNN